MGVGINVIAAYIGRWDIVRGHMADEGDACRFRDP